MWVVCTVYCMYARVIAISRTVLSRMARACVGPGTLVAVHTGEVEGKGSCSAFIVVVLAIELYHELRAARSEVLVIVTSILVHGALEVCPATGFREGRCAGHGVELLI